MNMNKSMNGNERIRPNKGEEEEGEEKPSSTEERRSEVGNKKRWTRMCDQTDEGTNQSGNEKMRDALP